MLTVYWLLWFSLLKMPHEQLQLAVKVVDACSIEIATKQMRLRDGSAIVDDRILGFTTKEKGGLWHLFGSTSTIRSRILVLKMRRASVAVTNEDLIAFHTIDRELYSIMVFELCRDPMETMYVSAFWLWLERVGYGNVVDRMLSIPDILITELADEALRCVTCVFSGELHPSSSSEKGDDDIYLTEGFLEKKISLALLLENQLIARNGVTRVLEEVCFKVLPDIMQVAIEKRGQMLAIDQYYQQQVLTQSGFNPPNLWNQPYALPAAERTMFVTFSKGYPVSEREIRDFFSMNFGNCMESMQMQEVKENEQALFALIVFHSESFLNVFLKPAGKVKLVINGKHVWGRKYIPKRPKNTQAALPPRPPPPPPPAAEESALPAGFLGPFQL